MRILQLAAILLFLALIGNLLKPLYWDRFEDLVRRGSDYGPSPPEGEEGPDPESRTGPFVTREGFDRFRRQVRERYARIADLDRLRAELQADYVRRDWMDAQVEAQRILADSVKNSLQFLILRGSQADSLMKGFVTEDRFTALQGFVQGLNRARRGGGIVPIPTGRPSFRRRHLWTGYHQIHPPYAMRAGGGR